MVFYKLHLKKSVRKKDLASVPKKDATRIVKRIKQLAVDPFPEDAVRLRGRDEWRIRQGNYRILYLVEQANVTVIVIKVVHRREAYRNL